MTHPGTWRETGCTSGLAGTLHLSGVRGHLADGVGVPFTEDTFWMPKRETGLGCGGCLAPDILTKGKGEGALRERGERKGSPALLPLSCPQAPGRTSPRRL